MYHLEMRVFGFTLNVTKNKVMGFETNKLVVSNKEVEQTKGPGRSYQLTQAELEVLLSLIKRSTFIGEDIENLYNLVSKLQQQYIDQTN
jgi:hypothetical protein